VLYAPVVDSTNGAARPNPLDLFQPPPQSAPPGPDTRSQSARTPISVGDATIMGLGGLLLGRLMGGYFPR